jgi:hypothetical protein
MLRLVLFGGAILVFIFWSIYKMTFDKKTTETDRTDIKLGFIFVAVFLLMIYFIFY